MMMDMEVRSYTVRSGTRMELGLSDTNMMALRVGSTRNARRYRKSVKCERMDRMEDLKLCPFCGSDDLTAIDIQQRRAVYCSDCLCHGPVQEHDMGDMSAEKIWNERPGK